MIRFHYLVRFNFKHRSRLRAFLLDLLKREGKKTVEAVDYIFCNDEYLLRLNRRHLQHNTLTDIITFDLSPRFKPLISEIYISIDRVRDNAILFSNSFEQELHRVIFHGALHLCGYNDKTAKEIKLMRKKEDEFLHEYLVSRESKNNKFHVKH